MKFDLISDTHWDFYFRADSNMSDRRIKLEFDKIFENQGSDVLIHAGDTGHYPKQDAQLFEALSKRYKKILVVGGNHTLYNVSSSQRYTFKTWQHKFQNWKDIINEVQNVEVLDGNIVEIDGVKFGGTMGWYDGSYYWDQDVGNPYKRPLDSIWRSYSNDAHKIPGLGHFLDIWQVEKNKIEKVVDQCHVMVTHIMPTTYDDFIYPDYQTQSSNAFYTFNYNEEVKNLKNTKIWCFGHNHKPLDKMLGNTRLICNPQGYPKENPYFEIKTIEV